MNRSQRHLMLVILVAVSAIAAGCAQSSPAPTQPPPTPTKVPPTPPSFTIPASDFPTGSFAMEDHDGKWVMAFEDDGSYTLTVDGRPMVRIGAYTVVQNQITLSDDSAPCVGKGDGVYSWAFDGQVLAFDLVKDACPGRRGTQHGSRWTREP